MGKHKHKHIHAPKRKVNKIVRWGRRFGLLSVVLASGVFVNHVVESIPLRGLAHSSEIGLAAIIEATFNKVEEETRG